MCRGWLALPDCSRGIAWLAGSLTSVSFASALRPNGRGALCSDLSLSARGSSLNGVPSVKSKQRVADHGEVFTPAWMVEAMLDVVKPETERIDSRFLEPACGSGNFLVQVLRRKLAAVQDGDRQMVEILTAVLSDGLPAVEAACADALRQGVHSADVIINILARRREPAAAVKIMTPDALRLRHEPAADCARYDSLRRAV